MSRKPSLNKKSKKLCLLKPVIDLQKHPSVKSLFKINDAKEQDFKEQKTNFIFNNNDEVNLIEIKKNKTNIGINIISCDHKIIDDKETFFIEKNIEDNLINEKKGSNIKIIPLKYEFNENEKKLDALITNQMAKGKGYKIIEKNFTGLLKVKNENY